MCKTKSVSLSVGEAGFLEDFGGEAPQVLSATMHCRKTLSPPPFSGESEVPFGRQRSGVSGKAMFCGKALHFRYGAVAKRNGDALSGSFCACGVYARCRTGIIGNPCTNGRLHYRHPQEITHNQTLIRIKIQKLNATPTPY